MLHFRLGGLVRELGVGIRLDEVGILLPLIKGSWEGVGPLEGGLNSEVGVCRTSRFPFLVGVFDREGVLSGESCVGGVFSLVICCRLGVLGLI